MAKLSSINNNKRRARMAKGKENTRSSLKAVIMNRELPLEERMAATIRLSEMPRNSAKIRVRNRCELSGRPRGFYRKFKLSRIAIRDMGGMGLIPGVIKASW
jgi:small subunit ribosomal protein S14